MGHLCSPRGVFSVQHVDQSHLYRPPAGGSGGGWLEDRARQLEGLTAESPAGWDMQVFGRLLSLRLREHNTLQFPTSDL